MSRNVMKDNLRRCHHQHRPRYQGPTRDRRPKLRRQHPGKNQKKSNVPPVLRSSVSAPSALTATMSCSSTAAQGPPAADQVTIAAQPQISPPGSNIRREIEAVLAETKLLQNILDEASNRF